MRLERQTRFRLHGPGTDRLGRAGLADGTRLSAPDSHRSVRVGCTNRFDRVRGKTYCCRNCQNLAKNALVPHSTLIHNVKSLNKLGTGMVLLRFGITHPTSHGRDRSVFSPES